MKCLLGVLKQFDTSLETAQHFPRAGIYKLVLVCLKAFQPVANEVKECICERYAALLTQIRDANQ